MRSQPYQRRSFLILLALASAMAATVIPSISGAEAQPDGFLSVNGRKVFPIGCYELPKEATALQAMAEAGLNLVRCQSREDLDRAAEFGLLGWIPLSVEQGPTDSLKERIESVRDHPALATWEGPDEIVWNFTAYSGLHRELGVHKEPGAWWKQTPEAIEYAEKKAQEVLPNIREGIALVRRLDPKDRPFWINEAASSDARYVRGYMDSIDITGCDVYPVKEDGRDLTRVAGALERWKQVGRGKPVWMVLQAFSWNELGDYYGAKVAAYPTFSESRFMAYNVIARGAKGILYWGSHYLKSETFRESLYALTSELAQLHPFLTAPEEADPTVNIIEAGFGEVDLGVCCSLRKAGDEYLLIVVNEDENHHMAVEIEDLNSLEGKTLHLLYGNEAATVQGGELLIRMLPYEVKVFATNRKWETESREEGEAPTIEMVGYSRKSLTGPAGSSPKCSVGSAVRTL